MAAYAKTVRPAVAIGRRISRIFVGRINLIATQPCESLARRRMPNPSESTAAENHHASMKPSARASALTDTTVLEIAKRIQRKRTAIADNPLLAQIAPSASGQGFLRRLGFGKVDIALSPEITLAKMLKEWHGLGSHCASAAFYRGGVDTPAEKAAQALKDLNDRIGLVEYRVFGTSPGEKYPQFSRLAEWLAWRIQLAHPEHRCAEIEAGWKPELFAFAVEDAKSSFQSPLLGKSSMPAYAPNPRFAFKYRTADAATFERDLDSLTGDYFLRHSDRF
jgi:hypothetical protein